MFKKKSFLSKLASSAKKATESYLDKAEQKEFGTNDPEEIKKISESNYRTKIHKDFDEKFNKAVSEDVTVDSEVVDDFDGEVIDGELIED